MFKKILVPLDGSELAERALEPALTLAQQVNGEAILLSVTFLRHIFVEERAGYSTLWPEQSMDYTTKELRAYLQSLETRKAHPNVALRPAVVEGDEAAAIVDMAADEDVDLIVMSTHGRSGFSRWMLGSVTERVLRHAACPVLVVRSAEPLSHMLITLDGSELAELALAPALEVARCLGSQVTLLRIEPILDVDPRTIAELDKAERGLGERMRQSLYDEAETYLQEVAERHELAELDVKLVTAVGPVATVILNYAESYGINVIAMATHGYSGLRRWVYGSVTEKVLHGAHCAMLIVRPPPHELNEG